MHIWSQTCILHKNFVYYSWVTWTISLLRVMFLAKRYCLGTRVLREVPSFLAPSSNWLYRLIDHSLPVKWAAIKLFFIQGEFTVSTLVDSVQFVPRGIHYGQLIHKVCHRLKCKNDHCFTWLVGTMCTGTHDGVELVPEVRRPYTDWSSIRRWTCLDQWWG